MKAIIKKLNGRSIIPLLVLLGLFLPSCNTSKSSDTATQATTDTLRVFAYNIKHGQGIDGKIDLDRIADVIGEKNPHLVALNEVDINTRRNEGVNTMEILARRLDMEPVFGKNISHQGGSYGNGILSAFPIRDSENIHLKQAEDGEQRGLLKTVVEGEGFTLAFMTTHLDHQSEENRKVAIDAIIEARDEFSHMPVIIAGDFNASPQAEEIRRMKPHFTDVWDEQESGFGYTIPVPKSEANRRIDYIFQADAKEGASSLKPIHMEVLDSEASDHLPIFAEFEVDRIQ